MKLKNDLRRGFSLVEVLVVIGIIAAIVGAVSTNMFGDIKDNKMNAAIDAVAVEIQAARTEAATTGIELLMKYSPEHNRLRLERIPEVDVIEYLSEAKDERRRAYLNKDGELIREYLFDPEMIQFKSVFLDGEMHDKTVAVFFGPGGQAEPHKLLFVDATNEDNKFAFEYRGFSGRLKEIEAEQFLVDFEDLEEEIPMVIEDEDFFEAGRNYGPPDPEGGPEGSDDENPPLEGSN